MKQAQVEKLGREWQARLLLDRWEIEWQVFPASYVNEERHLGNCATDTDTLTATISIAAKRPSAEIESTIIHELLHLVVAPLAAAGRLAAGRLSSEAAEIMADVIDAEAERAVRCLERVIASHASGSFMEFNRAGRKRGSKWPT